MEVKVNIKVKFWIINPVKPTYLLSGSNGLEYRRDNMTIVVKKVPKFLRGFVKFIFGIKNT